VQLSYLESCGMGSAQSAADPARFDRKFDSCDLNLKVEILCQSEH
jgi:hypothetical protein